MFKYGISQVKNCMPTVYAWTNIVLPAYISMSARISTHSYKEGPQSFARCAWHQLWTAPNQKKLLSPYNFIFVAQWPPLSRINVDQLKSDNNNLISTDRGFCALFLSYWMVLSGLIWWLACFYHYSSPIIYNLWKKSTFFISAFLDKRFQFVQGKG